MAIELDPAEFLDTTYGFAVSCTVAGVVCAGIFDNAYADAFGVVAGTSPMLLIPSSVVAAISNTVSVAGTSYTILRVEPDGTGMTRLMLQEA